MQVTVHLHTILQRQTPAGYQRRLEVTLPAGSTVADVLRELDISLPLDALLLVVAGRSVAPDYQLQDQDDVHLMPAMSGGSPGTPSPTFSG